MEVNVLSDDDVERLREHISRSVADQLLQDSSINWATLQRLDKPFLRIKASLQEGPGEATTSIGTVSHIVDLSGIATPSLGTPEVPDRHEAAEQTQQCGAHKRKRSSRQTNQDDFSAVPDVPQSTPHEDSDGHDWQTKSLPDKDATTTDDASESAAGMQRRAISSLRPVQATVDVEPDSSQRQIHSGDKFPKRRKQQPERHVLRPSSLDKLIQGIWEQIHGSLDLQPRSLLELIQQPKALECPGDQSKTKAMIAASGSSSSSSSSSNNNNNNNDNTSHVDVVGEGFQPPDQTGAFRQNNVFCSRVTQASRTCRSLEVIVQARWVEHFDAYVDSLLAAAHHHYSHHHHQAHHQHPPHVAASGAAPHGPAAAQAQTQVYSPHATPPARARLHKAALADACADFGWSEKELRNKTAIWRGYAEIRAAGGWAALVFAGAGVYRFCKYRVGFDPDSLARLRRLAPAFELAADTLQPGWRALLAAVGESSPRVYVGHPHDYVISLEPGGGGGGATGATGVTGATGAAGVGGMGSVVPLRLTYLQWDPSFTYRHIDECVIDERAWPGRDPRWTGPSPAHPPPAAAAAAFPCEDCGQEQSDDARRNGCACFPTLFGTTAATAGPSAPAPVLVFRTADGRNNGLLALCPFERGVAVGEFVGLVTRGLADVDVMEGGSVSSGAGDGPGGIGSGGGASRWQIWQGREGNFTRFVNHSCRANAQYQRFSWLGTQRIILVSKGIAAGEEVTVDYSDKYWKGLDKKCLCGQSCCRYRRDGLDAGRQ